MTLRWAVAFALLTAVPGGAQAPMPPGDPVELIVDDGSFEEIVAIQSIGVVFNLFSPDEFPVELTSVAVLWPEEAESSMELGDPFWFWIYEDPDEDLFNGVNHRATVESEVQFLDGTSFTTELFDPPLRFEGPGSIIVAVGQTAQSAALTPVDLTVPQLRSYIMNWDGSMPPPIPADGLAVISNLNLSIRGFGVVGEVPVTLQSLSIDR
jgi:hypothetical protein